MCNQEQHLIWSLIPWCPAIIKQKQKSKYKHLTDVACKLGSAKRLYQKSILTEFKWDMASLAIRSNCTNIWRVLFLFTKKHDMGEKQYKATDREISYNMQIHSSFSQVNSPCNWLLIGTCNVQKHEILGQRGKRTTFSTWYFVSTYTSLLWWIINIIINRTVQYI